MSEDTSKLLPTKSTENQAAPTLENKEEDTSEIHSPDLIGKINTSPQQQESKEEKKIIAVPPKKVVLTERIQNGKYKAVFRVIKEGKLPANLLIEPNNKWYLIHYLVMHGKLKELKVLITKFDCDINIIDAYQQTPLHMAALHSKKDIFQYLVQQPMVRLDTLDSFHSSPLINCVKSGFIYGFIYLFFEKGSDIKIQDTQGYTAAHWAAFKNSVPYLQLFKHIPTLIMDTADVDGMTPIFRAISGISYNSTKYLIRSEKVNLETRSTRRQTPLEFAESLPMHPKLLSYVKKHTELQKIEKRGLSKYVKEEGYKKGAEFIWKFLLKRFGQTYSIALNFLLLQFLLFSFIYMRPIGKFINGIFAFTFLCYAALFILLLIRKDPGYQPMKGIEHPTNAIAQILEQLRGGNWAENEEYCFSCLTNKPQGAFHCYSCGRCVNGYQFHLKPWQLGICIGKFNFPIYFLYEVMSLFCWYIYMGAMLDTAFPTPICGFPIYFVEQYLVLLLNHPIIALVFIGLLLRSMQKSYELLVMFTAIIKGMTVHELRNMHLYKYLFDIKDFGEQGKKYIHKRKSWSDLLGNLLKFCENTWDSLLGINHIDTNITQYIQLAETHKTEQNESIEIKKEENKQ